MLDYRSVTVWLGVIFHHDDQIARFLGWEMLTHCFLVGGFNPFEKYESKWKSSPNRGENKKYVKPPPSFF